MALFGGRPDKPSEAAPAQASIRQLPGRTIFCRICSADRPFSRCWERLGPLRACPGCNAVFENPAQLYQLTLPACPHCGEYLEQPGFQYGLCDGCQSKYEIVPGTRPSLLPNKRQRDEMDKFGKSWSRE